jgi:hypothetical protein
MWLKSHQWVDKPETVYERRRELRVRESRHSYMLFDQKYLDIDTGKFVRDKLRKIDSYALADIIDDYKHNTMSYGFKINRLVFDNDEDERLYNDNADRSIVYNFPKFTPKDDDFDKPKEIIIKEEESPDKHKWEKVYQKTLKEVDVRKAEEVRGEELERCRIERIKGKFSYIIKNKWIPK